MAASMVPDTRPRQPEALLAWMESLADATRLRLLRVLERHELGVAELTEILQLPQSSVSRHLKVLGDQGFVRSRAQGTTRLYRTVVDAYDAGARRLWLVAREQTDAWATAHQDRLRLQRRLAERGASEAEAFFARAAGGWDQLRRELYGEGFTQAALLGLIPGEWVVADLGCGTGHVATLLSPHVKQVIGVDRSAPMLKAARRRTAGLGNVSLRQGSLEALPIGDAECDAALMILVLSYVADPDAALREQARVLRPGGRAVVLDLLLHDREEFRLEMGQHSPGFAADALARRLEHAGLEAIDVRALPPAPKAKGPALLLATGRRTGAHPPPHPTHPPTRSR